MVRLVCTLPVEIIEGLEHYICKPLARVEAYLYAVFNNAPDKVERAAIFDELPHSIHYYIRLEVFIEVSDVKLCTVLCAFWVCPHPFLNVPLTVVRTSVFDASAAMLVHAPHEYGL